MEVLLHRFPATVLIVFIVAVTLGFSRQSILPKTALEDLNPIPSLRTRVPVPSHLNPVKGQQSPQAPPVSFQSYVPSATVNFKAPGFKQIPVLDEESTVVPPSVFDDSFKGTTQGPGSSNDDGNEIDDSAFFVRQHYLDFLNREPDAPGFKFWTNQVNECGSDASCREVRRINVSAAYFLSIEFQQSGYLIYRLNKSSFGTMPTYASFLIDTANIGQGVVVGSTGWEDKIASNQNAFVEAWINRADFKSRYDGLKNDQYVDALIANTGVTFNQADRDTLVKGLTTGFETRATVLSRIAENDAFSRKEFNPAFVLMQYFGYLRRNPDDAPDNNLAGFNFWLTKLNEFNGNFQNAEMVKAFISSNEYRHRFGVNSPASFYSLFSTGVFNAFPITIKLSNGTWRLYWYQASGGPEIPPNIVKQMSSSDGKTWSVGADLESSSTVLIAVNGIFETAQGDVLRFVEYYTDINNISAKVFRSTDKGATWDAGTTIKPPAAWVITYGPIYQLANGTILVTAYDALTPSGKQRSILLQSKDNGATYTLRSVIKADVSNDYNETSMINTGGKNWVALMRFNSAGLMQIRTSSDDGVTWTGSAQTIYGQSPWLTYAPDGLLYCFFRGTGEVLFYIHSSDNGVNWSSATQVGGTEATNGNGYPTTISTGGYLYTFYFYNATSKEIREWVTSHL